jgi:hypothetical protein
MDTGPGARSRGPGKAVLAGNWKYSPGAQLRLQANHLFDRDFNLGRKVGTSKLEGQGPYPGARLEPHVLAGASSAPTLPSRNGGALRQIAIAPDESGSYDGSSVCRKQRNPGLK